MSQCFPIVLDLGARPGPKAGLPGPTRIAPFESNALLSLYDPPHAPGCRLQAIGLHGLRLQERAGLAASQVLWWASSFSPQSSGTRLSAISSTFWSQLLQRAFVVGINITPFSSHRFKLALDRFQTAPLPTCHLFLRCHGRPSSFGERTAQFTWSRKPGGVVGFWLGRPVICLRAFSCSPRSS